MQPKWATAAVLNAVLAACGGDDEAPTAKKTSEETAPASVAAAHRQIPQELLGTWETSVPRKKIENMPNEYIGASPRWTITISESGGVDDLGICDEYEQPQTYSYALEGDELAMEVVESPCPDVAYLHSLFTTQPLKRVD